MLTYSFKEIDMKDPNLSSEAGSIQNMFRAKQKAKKDKAARVIQKSFKSM